MAGACFPPLYQHGLLGCETSDSSKVPAAASTPSHYPDVGLALPISSACLRSMCPRSQALCCNFRHQINLMINVINKEPVSGPRSLGQ